MDKLNNNALKKLKNEKGITLMVVIITIIVMVILLGVTVRLSIEGELISSAEKVENSTIGEIEEGQEKIDSIIAERDDATILDDAFVPQYVEESYSDGNGLKNYRIYGNSVQNGTPTPTSPIEIQSVGDKTKNLFNSKIISNEYCTVENNSVKVKIIASNSSSGTGKTLKELCPDLEIGKKYIISYTHDSSKGANISIGAYNSANIWLSGTTRTITATDLEAKVRMGREGDVSSVGTVTFSNIQVQEGSEVTEYEPYGKYKIPVKATNETGESVTTNIYLDEPLRKVGDYADFIDFENQRIVRNVGNVVLDTSLPYVFYNYNTDLDNTYHYYINVSNKVEPQIIKETEMLCNRFVGGNITMNRNESDSFLTSRYGTRVYGQIQKSLIDQYDGATEKDRLIQFLNEHYTELDYVLITPKIQYINLPKINTLEGNNIITIQTKIEPSDVILEF